MGGELFNGAFGCVVPAKAIRTVGATLLSWFGLVATSVCENSQILQNKIHNMNCLEK